MMSHWQLEISHDRRTYTTDMGTHHTSGLVFASHELARLLFPCGMLLSSLCLASSLEKNTNAAHLSIGRSQETAHSCSKSHQ